MSLQKILCDFQIKLFEQLGKCVENGPAKGIYHINNWDVNIPIQIVVTGELDGEEYSGFRAISKKPKEKDVLAFMKKHGKNKEISSFVRAFADGVSHVDSVLMEDIKGRYPDMGKTLMQIMQPEIDVVVKDAVNEAVTTARADEHEKTTRSIYFTLVQDGDLTLERAAEKSGMTTDEFTHSMNEYVKRQHTATR